jgi:hypothetical protein
MAFTPPLAEPLIIVAGDLASWKRTLSDFPASVGWVLSYAFARSGSQFTITASASGNDHLISVPAATTATWAAGLYTVQGYVTNGSERHIVFEADLQIESNLATASGGLDTRSHARKVLDALEAVLEARASKSIVQWTGLEQSFSLIPTPDLVAMREKYRVEYQAEVAASNIARGLGNKRNVFVRFTIPR